MDFVAIDVETANPDMASICQIGIARFEGGQLVETWSSFIDPEDRFSPTNVAVHGIEPEMVKGQPKLPEVAERISSMLGGRISVHHTHFDRISVNRAFGRYRLPELQTTWLDSAWVVRQTWQDMARKGYGLHNVCQMIGYQFKHHDALEDAKAAGHVMLAAMRESQTRLHDWLSKADRPPTSSSKTRTYNVNVTRDGNPEGALYGEVVVFTGELQMSRLEAADIAASIGCRVASSVTKKTTLLVVGDQDVTQLAGHDKSTKHRRAEELIGQGQPIRILRETDFRFMVDGACGNS